MHHHHHQSEQADNVKSNALQLPGVIDTIGIGYSHLVLRPSVVVLPVLLDLYFWFGVRIPADSLVNRVGELLRTTSPVTDGVRGFLLDQRGYNLAEFLSMRLPTVRVPTIFPVISQEAVIRGPVWRPDLSPMPWWAVLILLIVFLVVGFWVGAEYLLWLGAVARGTSHKFDGRRTTQTALRLVGWLTVAALLFLLVALPLIVVQLAFELSGVGTSGFVQFLFLVPLAIGFALFFFGPFSIAGHEAGVFEAFRGSFKVVRRFFGPSVGFFAAYLLVTGAIPLAWAAMVGHPAGTLIAVVGHAFVTSGMIASAFVFYRDRAEIALAAVEG